MNANQPIVPYHVCMEVKRLYAEVNSRGRRVWSQAALAKHLGLSETTVYRIVNEYGPYQHLQQPKDDATIKAEAAASAQRLLEELSKPAEPKPKENAANDRTDQPAIDTVTGKPLSKRYF